MKKLLALFALAIFTGCDTADKDGTKSGDSTSTTTSTSTEKVTYAYPIMYSSQFEMGDAKKAETIVNLWKEFDNNTLNSTKSLFADSVIMMFPGMTMNTTKDSMFAMTQGYRDGFATVTSSIDAVFATRSTDKNEDWVCIWGRESKTDKKGKTDSARLHEIWRFNKDGKIDYMAQFIQPLGPPAK